MVAATRALREGRPDDALGLLDEGGVAAPGRALTEERAAARAIALCDLGRSAEGRAAAESFAARFPRSPLAPRVRGACADR